MGCGTDWSYVFFYSFQIIFKMIVLNLFVAVILNSFEDYSHRTKYLINDKSLIKLVKAWGIFDKKGIGIIHAKHFIRFLY